VIAVMGQPEDYIIEEDNHDTHSYSGAAPRKQKNYTEILKRNDQFLPDLVTILELMPYGLEYSLFY
jgi:hypothetical protein